MDGRSVMTPIGIDLSLTSSGVSCGATLVALVSPHKGVQRLIDIADQIQNIATAVHAPIAIIEGYSFASRNSHAHAIGELGGVVRVMLYQNEIRWIDIPPTTRAKFATGRGNASKTEVMSAVSAKTGVVFAGKGADDMCDAWVLEEIGLTKYGKPRVSWPESQLRALDKVEWV